MASLQLGELRAAVSGQCCQTGIKQLMRPGCLIHSLQSDWWKARTPPALIWMEQLYIILLLILLSFPL